MAWCGGLRVDHGQKHDPRDEILVLRDLTNKGLRYEEKLAAIGFSKVEGIFEWIRLNGPTELLLLDLGALGEVITTSQLDRMFKNIPYILITDQDQDQAGMMSSSRLKMSGALTKPLNSRSLAGALYSKIDGGTINRLPVCRLQL